MPIQKKSAGRASTTEVMQSRRQKREGQDATDVSLETRPDEKPTLKQISAKIPTDVHRQVRIKCLQDGVEMQHVIAALLAEWVRK